MIEAEAASPSSATTEVKLSTGRLTLRVDEADWPLDSLSGFAIRNNPRRAFLIVSKVLGRHVPAKPSAMAAAMLDLAARVPGDLPEPFLAIGLAETAVGLGQGIFAALRAQGRQGSFLASTRQIVDHPTLCRFEEPHSHAPAHLVYRPERIDLAAIRSLLLVDDEVSTGTTLVNAASALLPALPRCQSIAVATLTDWTGGDSWLARFERPAARFSLLSGQLSWRAAPASVEYAPPDPAAAGFGAVAGGALTGRLGCSHPQSLPPLDDEALRLPPHSRVRVVGTGEFTYLPFLLAEALEKAGHDVVVQAATRSPVRLGGAIGAALSFRDNYGSGAGSFLYNADRDDGRINLICHETPPGSVDPALIEALGGRAIYFGSG